MIKPNLQTTDPGIENVINATKSPERLQPVPGDMGNK